MHCEKYVRIGSYADLYAVWMPENTDHNNSEYGHFSRSNEHHGTRFHGNSLNLLKFVFLTELWTNVSVSHKYW